MLEAKEILAQRQSEYGDYKDNCFFVHLFTQDIYFEKIYTHRKECITPPLDLIRVETLTKIMMGLKLARLEKAQSKQAIKDTTIDFYNYYYLYLKNFFDNYKIFQSVALKLSSRKPLVKSRFFKDLLSPLVNRAFRKEDIEQVLDMYTSVSITHKGDKSTHPPIA